MPTLNSPKCKQKLIQATKGVRPRFEQFYTRQVNDYFKSPTSKSAWFKSPVQLTTERLKPLPKWMMDEKEDSISRSLSPMTPPHIARVVAKQRSKCSRQKCQQARTERISKLSKPRRRSDKYIPPPPKKCTWTPSINKKKRTKPEKCRPYEPVQLPSSWFHDELEMEFWRDMRFPISCKALKYKITDRVLQLAEPRQQREHCPVPKKEEPKITRVRMTPDQWTKHLKRLENLSNPIPWEDRAKKTEQKMMNEQHKLICQRCKNLLKQKRK